MFCEYVNKRAEYIQRLCIMQAKSANKQAHWLRIINKTLSNVKSVIHIRIALHSQVSILKTEINLLLSIYILLNKLTK